MEIINVNEEIIEVNVTEEVVNIVTQTGAYPLPSNVFSVFNRVGNVVGQAGDYTTSIVGEGSNLYFTNARSRSSISENITGINYDSASGIFSMASGYVIPTQVMLDAKVPYTGATGDVNIGTYDLKTAKVWLLDEVEGDYGSIHLADNSMHFEDAHGHTMFLVEDGFIQIHKDPTIQSNIFASDLTATRNHFLPNASGTLALTSDISYPVTSVFGRTGAVISANGDYTTSQVTEGSNLYFTNARVHSAISATAPLSEVSGVVSISQSGASTDGFLNSSDWNTFNNKEGAVTAGTTAQYYRGDKTFQALDTLAVAENTNLYYTQARFDTAFGNKSTTNLSEGTNLYYTDARARAAITGTLPISVTSGVVSISQAGGASNGFLSSIDWNTFNNKQAALSGTGFVKSTAGVISYDTNTYLTTISGIAAGGELSGTYANPSLVNSAVTGKVLTGLNLLGGGTIADTDSILGAFGKVQNQISALVGGVMYEGTWNASTNTPTIVSSVGAKGDYYIVATAGSTNINGITSWNVGDWIIFNGTTWDKVDNTDAVSSVNGYTGAVSLVTSDVPESGSLYFTNARAIGSTLTGYTSGAGVVAATDTILQAVQKLNGNVSGLVTGVSSVFGRTGAVIATSGDYTTTQVTEGTNLYYTEARVNANTNVAANTAARHAAVTIGTANGLSLSTQALSLAAASTSTTGALTSTDWNTFNGKQSALNGTGFIKISGTTISYDNSTYLTTSSAASTYLPLAGGTLTGPLGGTSASFSSNGTFGSGSSDVTITIPTNNTGSGYAGRILGKNATGQLVIQHRDNSATFVDAITISSGGGIPQLTFGGVSNFTSNLNLGTIANIGDSARFNIKQASTAYNNGIYLERGGERNGYFMYIGGAVDSLTFRRNYFGTQSDVMSLTRDGNVGIGASTNSQNLLEVSAAGGSQRIRVGTLQNNNNTARFEAITSSTASTANSAWLRVTPGGGFVLGQSSYTKAGGDSGNFANLSGESESSYISVASNGAASFSNNVSTGGAFVSSITPGGYTLDSSGSFVTLANGAFVDFPAMSGMILVNNTGTGAFQVFICGGGNTASLGNVVNVTGTMTHSPGVGGYRFTNNTGSTWTFAFQVFRTRGTA